MILIHHIKEINNNCKITTSDIMGKIVKVSIQSNKPIPHVNVKIITNEFEEVINHKLENNFVILYPVNTLTPFATDSPMKDYFYSSGPLGIEVLGMKETDIINFIKIFYE